jgi:hypothetical protein
MLSFFKKKESIKPPWTSAFYLGTSKATQLSVSESNMFIYCNCLIWNVTIYTANPKQQPISLHEEVYVVSSEYVLFVNWEVFTTKYSKEFV